MVHKSEVRTKAQALEITTSFVRSVLQEDTTDDLIRAMGYEPAKMTKAEVTRLNWAMEQVDARLERLSKQTIR